MNERKERFTTGPWQYANYTDFLEIQNTDPVNPKEIAYIDGWTDEQEAKANAALIAAAPEMYARLEQVAEDFEALGLTSNRDSVLRLLAKCRGENTNDKP